MFMYNKDIISRQTLHQKQGVCVCVWDGLSRPLSVCRIISYLNKYIEGEKLFTFSFIHPA